MVTPEHSQIGSAVNKAIDNALRRMGLDLAINHYHAADIDVNGRMKQPDMAWGPTRTPRGRHKRPTVVLEVAVSETKSKLHRDMDLWLDPGRGNANVAIGIKANRKRPMISIEKWVWDDVKAEPFNHSILKFQKTSSTKSNCLVVHLSSPLITFSYEILNCREGMGYAIPLI